MKKVSMLIALCLSWCGINLSQAASITWGYLQWEASTTPSAGGDFEAMGLAYAEGITDAATKDHNAIIAQIGYGTTADPTETASWTWKDAAFHSEWGQNFAYQQKITAPWVNGTFYYTYRFRLNETDSDWKYAGTNGLWNGSSSTCKTFIVSNGYEITWAKIDWQAASEVDAGTDFEADAYVYSNGISTVDPQRTDLVIAQIGYGLTADPNNSDWTWTNAAYRGASGSNMAYQQKIAAPQNKGNYYYTYRFRINSLGANWIYAGNDGLWNATTSPCKTFTVTGGYEITWAKLDWIDNANVAANGTAEMSSYVYCNGISTETEPDASKIIAQVGYGTTANPTDGDWVWTNATYKQKSGNNMMYQQQITAPSTEGTYYYAFRYRLAQDGMPWVYAGENGIWNATTSPCKTFKAYRIIWAYLQWQAATEVAEGADFEAMGLVYCDDISTEDPQLTNMISAQIGYGSTANPNNADWTWTDAAYNSKWGDNMAYQQKIKAPATAGTYYYSYRFKLNLAGSSWTYAGSNGLWNATTSPCKTFKVYQISWANLQWQSATEVTIGAKFEATGLVFCNDVSTVDPQLTNMMSAQIGYGITSDPHNADWTWEDAAYNSKWGSNMAYQQKITAPATAGTYYYTYRFKLNLEDANWVYAGDGDLWDATEHPCKTFTTIGSYTRSTTAGAIGTVCVPNEVSAYTGVTLYEIAYLEKDGSNNPVQIFVDEVTSTTMTAGKPYIFVANSTSMELTYGATNVDAPAAGTNGLVGTFTEIAATTDNVLVNNYIISENKFWTCQANCSLPANRAYIDATMIPTEPSEVPVGARRIALGNGHSTATSLQLMESNASYKKVMLDGKMLIIRDSKKFNAQGQKL